MSELQHILEAGLLLFIPFMVGMWAGWGVAFSYYDKKHKEYRNIDTHNPELEQLITDILGAKLKKAREVINKEPKIYYSEAEYKADIEAAIQMRSLDDYHNAREKWRLTAKDVL